MSVIDVDGLLRAVSEDAPCGADLEYDSAFGEVVEASRGKPEQEFGNRDGTVTVRPAEEPDWRAVKSRSVDLLGRTKDLRIAIYLTQALAATEGLVGMSDGMDVVYNLLDRYWETVHPQLDADDDNDPTMRANALAALCGETTLAIVRDAPLVESRLLGKVTLRHLQVAEGKASARDQEPVLEASAIEGAFLDCDPGELKARADAVEHSLNRLRGIDALLTEKIGPRGPDLSRLDSLFNEVRQALSERLARRGIGEAASSGPGSDGTPGAPRPETVSGEINSREDAMRMLDKISDYFQKFEPSSPVPLLIRRAKRLVSKSFLEIVRDMAPDGVSQAETIAGVDSQDGE